MNKVLLIIGTLIAIGSGVATAAPLSPAQALQRAGTELQPGMKAGAIQRYTASDLAYTVSDAMAQPTIYVFAHKGSNGFIITGADEVAAPVIGYSDESVFSADAMPCCLAWMLDEYSKEIASAKALNQNRMRIQRQKPTQDYAPIAPICATKWNQSAPYNNTCPIIDGKRSVTGCVATAMAQVIKKHNYPERGAYTHSYTWKGETYTYSFKDSVFNWAKMTDTYSASSTPEEEAAVANLMHACGVSVDMMYSPTGSGAYSTVVANALTTYFTYGPSTQLLSRNTYTLDSWNDIAYRSIQAGCPVYVSGSNSSAGHAFVADGYDANGFFHINWGWGGTSDGYFLFTALDPASQGIGGSNAGYNLNENFVIMAQPDNDTAKPIYFMFANAGMSLSLTENKNEFKVTGPFNNLFAEAGSVTGYLGLKLTSSDGSVRYVTQPDPSTFNTDRRRTASFLLTMPELANGTYQAEPYMNLGTPENPIWQMIYMPLSRPQGAWFTVENNKITILPAQTTIEYPTVSNVTFNSPFYKGYTFSVSGTLKNVNLQFEYNGLLYACLFSGTVPNLSLKANTNPMLFDVNAGDSWDFNIVGKWVSEPANGNYKFAICTADADGYVVLLSDLVDVKVSAAPSGTPALSMSNISVVNSTNADPDNVAINCDIKCTKGYFASALYMFLMDANGTYLNSYCTTPTLFITQDETKQYTFNPSWSVELKENTSYRVQFQNGNTYLATAQFSTGNRTGIESTVANGDFSIQNLGNIIKAVSPDEIKSLKVYNIGGTLQYAPVGIAGNEAEVDVANLPTGIYLVSIATQSTAKTFRVVIK